jgi:hypothetical protein
VIVRHASLARERTQMKQRNNREKIRDRPDQQADPQRKPTHAATNKIIVSLFCSMFQNKMQRFVILIHIALLCLLPLAVVSSYSFKKGKVSSVFKLSKSIVLLSPHKALPPPPNFGYGTSLQQNREVKGVLCEAPRGGGGSGKEVSTEEFRFSDDQRAVFARMRRTMTLLGTLGIFTSTITFLKDMRDFLQQSPQSNYFALISSPSFLQLFFSIILPTAADISLARLQLLLSRVFAEIESPDTRNEENDISALMKSLKIYEGYLSKKRLPAVLKTVAIVVVLITTGLNLARNAFSQS